MRSIRAPIAAGTALIMLALALSVVLRPPDLSHKAVQELIEQEFGGTSEHTPESALYWMRDRGLDPKHVLWDPPPIGYEQAIERCGVRAGEVGSLIYAMVRDTGRGFLTRGDSRVTLIFDRDQRLIAFDVWEIITGW